MKQEKVSLQTEVERYKQENRGYEHELRSLGQTLQTIDQRQRQLVVSLAHLLQSPAHGSSLMDQSESPNKKRRLMALHYLKDEANSMMIKDDSNSNPSSLPLVDLKEVEKLDTSLTFLERFLHGMDQIPSENGLSCNVPLLAARVAGAESPASPGDSDFSIPSCTPECLMSGTPSQGCRSSPEMAASPTYVDSLPMSSIRIDPESRHRPSVVDMNISPGKSPDARSAKDQEQNGGFQSVPANDVFWQQFLTEAPASSMMQGVESERRELYDRADPSRFGDEQKPWWIVDSLGQHMGHLRT